MDRELYHTTAECLLVDSHVDNRQNKSSQGGVSSLLYAVGRMLRLLHT